VRPEEDLLSAEHLEEEQGGSELEVDPGVGSGVEEGVNKPFHPSPSFGKDHSASFGVASDVLYLLRLGECTI
jgi:hypothetical protein